MEGARMIDEWPIIERRIKNDQMVFRRSAAAGGLELAAAAAPVEPEIEFDFGFDLDREAAGEKVAESTAKADDTIELTAEEQHLLARVDGTRTVREICDLVALGDFDTYRLLADLLARNLIEEVPRGRSRENQPVHRAGWERLRVAGGMAMIGILAAASLVTLRANPFTPWRVLAGQPAGQELRRYVSLSRLQRIERALTVFYLDAGTLPSELSLLVHGRYVVPEDLTDSAGRAFAFQLSPGGWRLAADAEDPGDLTVTRSFNPAQQLMLSSSQEVPPSATE
jgi:hypothetical protein